ncbi:uncharacterized protein LOC117565216 [Drosophila albomicans]|uniref:Gamma-tubulin complex component n=1 Tax=Drosophila albomicans TaxID=7291 RepID=A0A6P8XPE9_DROAB|nr:uncharacterized protein LOC117565216 [Drosophila albomicans]
MSEEQQKLPEAPSVMDRNKVFKLLGKLSISLGCSHPNLDHILQVFKPQKPRADIEVLDIQKRFKSLENNAKDRHLLELLQLRSKLFLYLHGMLLKLEPDDRKRRLYLILCYKLFDANKPKVMPLSAMLAYREEYIDRLMKLVQKIIHINEVDFESARLASRINALCQLQLLCKERTVLDCVKENENLPTLLGSGQQMLMSEKDLKWETERKVVKYLPVQFKVNAFAYLQCIRKQSSSFTQWIGFKWQQEQRKLTILEDIYVLRADTQLRESVVYSVNLEYQPGDHVDLLSMIESEQPSELCFMQNAYRDEVNQTVIDGAADVGRIYSTIEELSALPSSNTGRWQHERYAIAAPRPIILAFRSNPAYQCSEADPMGPDFFEQLLQFSELTATKTCPLNRTEIKQRIKIIMRQNMSHDGMNLNVVARMGLQEFLTEQEKELYESLRWQHRDRGEWINLSQEARQRDVLTGMLGAVCMQLKPSALKARLLLRSPHHQQSISESFLLLSIGHVGHLYGKTQHLLQRLSQLDDSGLVLAYCLRDELLVLHAYHETQKLQPENMLRIYWHTRDHQLRFQWYGEIYSVLDSGKASLLTSLHLQLGLNAHFDELLQQWLLLATYPLLGRISKWLLNGELHQLYFIVEHKEHADGPLYWHSYFELIDELLPPFLNRELAQLLLGVGRSHRYARRWLNVELTSSVYAEQLQQQLNEACRKCYEEKDEESLKEIILDRQQETSKALLLQLGNLLPTPLEIFSKLHQYLLLSDVNFVRGLIELLEPALEQSVNCYNVQLLDNLMKQLLDKHNEQLFVDKLEGEADGKGKQCWSSFLLRWRLPCHWTPLIGDRIEQYSSCFVSLWQLHHADYVLCERIRRQQVHFLERTGLDQSKDALQVAERFVGFIDKLMGFMTTLRDYFLNDILGSALKSLYDACSITSSLDALLALHAEYLNYIECGLFQTKRGLKSHLRLAELYEIIFRLDAEQQKFLSLCHKVDKSVKMDTLKSFHWTCHSTCHVINILDDKFQQILANFLLALFSTGSEQFIILARKLSRDRNYANKCKKLEIVNTFRFLRKFPY